MVIFLFIDFHQCNENKQLLTETEINHASGGGGGVEGESGYHFLRVNYNKILPIYLTYTALETEPHALIMAYNAGLWLK